MSDNKLMAAYTGANVKDGEVADYINIYEEPHGNWYEINVRDKKGNCVQITIPNYDLGEIVKTIAERKGYTDYWAARLIEERQKRDEINKLKNDIEVMTNRLNYLEKKY